MVLLPGFHRGISKAHYLADPTATPSLSASIAKLIVNRSPSHAWSAHPKGGRYGQKQSEAMRTGTLMDSLLLGSDTELVTLPATMSNAKGEQVPTNGKFLLESAKTWRDQHLAAGRLPVDAKELEHAKSAAETIRERWARDGAVLDGENQLTLIWREGDVECKARLDHWREPELLIHDVKIVECAHPDAVARKMIDLGWDIQAAAYTSAVETLRPEWAGRVRMVLLFAEPEPPYETLVRPLAGTMRELGRWKWERAVRLWAECLRSRRWPGYSGMEAGLEAPPWALAKMEETLVGGSDGISF